MIHPKTPEEWEEYEKRVRAYEEKGLTRSDAQGVVDVEWHNERSVTPDKTV